MRKGIVAGAALVAGVLLCGPGGFQAGAQQPTTSAPAQSATTQTAGTQAIPWTYDGRLGALRWDKLNPDWRVCANGKRQSPINIHKVRLDKTLPPIQFHYLSGTMKLINDGHTVRVTPPEGSYITIGGVRYDLVEFHFHHPGEEVIDNTLSDMSVQFVHRGTNGKTVILAVELNEGNANAILAGLWEQLPKSVGATGTTTIMLNPVGLIPTDRGYWSYTGSLTEPPCTEGVQWYVFQNPVSLSREQLNAFGALFKRNTRPEQLAHGRHVEASE
jgi:carbonic anhydrase